ncbi:MAG: hypothetical protein NC302_01510 [Bacteroidales bacterium]|nr:hypothetical protein [Bacteroidales bacterium]MCM1414651.1 hypothetical protein [bacterium]MCM1424683.1 hypothetical protein [bacterium]
MNMKIGEAQKLYRQQLSLLRGQKSDFVKQQKENREKMETAQKKSEEQGVIFELSEAYLAREKELQEKIDELSGQIKDNEKTLDDLIEQEVGIFNSVVGEQQADAMREYGEEMAKCLEIARRISNGDRVPAQDEKKLMDFDMEIYQMAKEMAAMNMDKKHKEWDSLWGEEEEKEYEDPFEASQNAETNVEMPEGMEAVTEESGS